MIFAAGKGTRLRPLTDTLPKALLPLGNGKTLLQYQIEKLREVGMVDIIINIHHLGEQIIHYLDVHHNFGCNITISDERDGLLETGGGLYNARQFFEQTDDPFLCCNVDILHNLDYLALVDDFTTTHSVGEVVVSDRVTQRYFLFDDKSVLRGWTNVATGQVKPEGLVLNPQWKKLAFSGIHIYHPSIFVYIQRYITQVGNVFSLTDFDLSLIDTAVIKGYVPKDYRMMDVGKIDQLSKIATFL